MELKVGLKRNNQFKCNWCTLGETVGDLDIEVVHKFGFLGDRGGVNTSVMASIRSVWSKFRELLHLFIHNFSFIIYNF